MRFTLHHFDGHGTICGGSGKQPGYADGDQWKFLFGKLRFLDQLYLQCDIYLERGNLRSRTQSKFRPSKLWILGRPHYRHRKLHVGQWCYRNQQNSVASNQSIPPRGTGDHAMVDTLFCITTRTTAIEIIRYKYWWSSFYADINRHMATNHKNLYCTCFRNGYFKLDYTVRPQFRKRLRDRRYLLYI